MSEYLSDRSIFEIVPGNEESYGLQLEHGDNRRKIYSIKNIDQFLDKSTELHFGFSANKIKDLFDQYPSSLKQLFLITPQESTIKLGEHYHRDTSEGGNGTEIFIFIKVENNTQIKIEQYHLGRSSGTIKYEIKTGDVLINNPNDYHIFTANGPFAMIQISEAPDFIPEDLNKFNKEDFSEEDNHMVNGYGELPEKQKE